MLPEDIHTSKKARRIAIIAGAFPPAFVGGIDSSNYNLYRMLLKKGYEVRVFSFHDSASGSSRDNYIVRFCIGKLAEITIGIYIGLCRRLANWTGIAYAYSDVLKSYPAYKISRPLRKFDPGVVIFPDQGAPAYYIKRIRGARSILISHHNPMRFLDMPLIGVHSRRDAEKALSYEMKALRKIDRVLCPSKYMARKFGATYKFTGPIDVVPNLLDSEYLDGIESQDVRPFMGLGEESKIIYIPSASSEIKGGDYVFEIMRRISLKYTGILGFYLSGALSEKLKSQIEISGANIKYFAPGKSSYEENIQYVKSCSICVSPTLLESFGMALAESMCCGLPVVAFDVDGVSEIVENGVNGYLVPLIAVDDMIEKTLELLEDTKLSEFGVKSRVKFNEKISTGKVFAKYEEILYEGFECDEASSSERCL